MANILNNILCTLMIFALTFAWAVYCLKDAVWAACVACIVSACACYIIFAVLSKHTERINKQNRRKKMLKNFFTFLQFNENLQEVFCPMLKFFNYEMQKIDFENVVATKIGRKKASENAEQKKEQFSNTAICFDEITSAEQLVCNKKGSDAFAESDLEKFFEGGDVTRHRNSGNKRVLANFCFATESVNAEQIRKAVLLAKRHRCDKILIFCNRADSAVKKIACAQMPTEFVDIANTFALFETAEKMPHFAEKSVPKNRLLPQYMFDKRRFGWYFFGAVFTLFTAAISLMKVYLLIWATALFCLAFYSLFNKKYNGIPTDVRL